MATATWFGQGLLGQWSGTAARRSDYLADEWRVTLHTVTYSPNKDTDDFFDDATNEITGTGYSANGVALGSKTLTYDSASDEIRLDAADVQWTSASFTARHAIVWVNTAGASSTDPLEVWVDFGGDETVSTGTFTIQWASNGLAVIDCT